MDSQLSFRLFIAVEIPSEATARLVAWQRRYLEAEKALRLTPVDQLHITMVFLGQMGAEQRDEVAAELEGFECGEGFTAAAVKLVGLPRARQPRVVAAAIEEPTGKLASLQSRLSERLACKNLYKQEKRRYFPHVTVARARGRVTLDVREIHPEPVKFTAVRVTLYNSILKSTGALHEPLKTVRLT